MAAEKFQIYSVKITANTFVSQKIESVFTHAHKKNLPRNFIIIFQADGNCPFLPNSVFWRNFFLRKKVGWGGGEDYGVEKNTKINKGIGHKFW